MNRMDAVEEAKNRGLKFVAMDKDGKWYGYKEMPKQCGTIWRIGDGWDAAFLGRMNTIDWRDTLTEVK